MKIGFRKTRNTTPGNWAFGVSYSADLGELMIHFAVWHFGACVPKWARI